MITVMDAAAVERATLVGIGAGGPMFVDIVDSTATAAAVGDGRWRAVLDRWEAMVERQLRRSFTSQGRYTLKGIPREWELLVARHDPAVTETVVG